jgi:hypothetical protein
MLALRHATATPALRSITLPVAVDFQFLTNAQIEHSDLYERTIGPIRNNVFAHTGRITQSDMYELFQNVPMVEFQRLA